MIRSLLCLALALSVAACDTGADVRPASSDASSASALPEPRTVRPRLPDPRTAYPQARRLKVRYGAATDGRQDMEIYVPEGFGPFPVAVLVHGGGFISGSRDAVVPVARMLQERGVIGVATSYRLSPDVPEPDNPARVQHPNHTDDVATAIRWLVDHAAELRADGDGFVLLGHSSGTTIATVLAFAPDYLARAGVDRSRIRGLLRLDGHTSDLEIFVPRGEPYTNPSIINIFGAERERLYPAIVGTDDDGQPIYDAPHPMNLSPWYNVRPGADLPAAFVASGSAPDRALHSQLLHDRLIANGHASVRVETSLDHGRMLGALRDPATLEETDYRQAVLDFIQSVVQD